MVWLRRFAIAAALSALVAGLLSLAVEQSLAVAVGLAGLGFGGILAFARRRQAERADDPPAGDPA